MARHSVLDLHLEERQVGEEPDRCAFEVSKVRTDTGPGRLLAWAARRPQAARSASVSARHCWVARRKVARERCAASVLTFLGNDRLRTTKP
jgi:hypothetical protein